MKKVEITSNMEDMYEETGIIHDQPKHPEYAIKTKRLTTYKYWPKHIPQTPEILAGCGFYSLGIADRVKCFFCDGSLHSWDSKDDPWEEHARWFPECGYLHQQKGMAFIKAVNKKYPCYPTSAPGMEQVETSSPESDTLSSVSGSQGKKDKKNKKKTDGGGSDTKVLEEQIRVLKEERMCKVCLDELTSIVFLPCGHMVCCATCAPALRVCPICRDSIKGNVKAYIS